MWKERNIGNVGMLVVGWVLAGTGIFWVSLGTAFMTVLAAVPMESNANAPLMGMIFVGIGALLLAIGLLLLLTGYAKRARARRLMREGTCYDAEIVDARYTATQVNHRPGVILVCRYTDAGGSSHLVRSAPQWQQLMLRNPEDYRARVWVDPYDAKQYHVEVQPAALVDRPVDYDDR